MLAISGGLMSSCDTSFHRREAVVSVQEASSWEYIKTESKRARTSVFFSPEREA